MNRGGGNSPALRGVFICFLALPAVNGGVQEKFLSESIRPHSKEPWFSEVAAESGLVFEHFTGATGQYYLPEIMGAGGALFDYDSDGDLDVLLVQGTMLDDQSLENAIFPFPLNSPQGHRLFRNDLIDPSGNHGDLVFVDVTEEAGLNLIGYGMGVAIGDYNNDGHLDVYITQFGSNILLRNNGDGTFIDATVHAGVDDTRWSTAATFFDYNQDGYLDLFVVNYIDFTVAGNKTCFDSIGGRDYCNPRQYRPMPDQLFRNNKDGTFTNVTQESNLSSSFGPGLGVVAADFNRDGWMDLYVANDGAANLLWLNQGDGTFQEDALMAGAAFNAEGAPEGSMGVAAGDFDQDGDEDLFMTHLTLETNTLYVNEGEGYFQDETVVVGLAAPSYAFTGFGTGWFDYDNDGLLDLFIANGAVNNLQEHQGDPYPFHQINQLFRNLGESRFQEMTSQAGPALALSEVSRGTAFGDIDNDGDVDILLTNNKGPVRLFLNRVGNKNHWLRVRLVDSGGIPEAVGARIGVIRSGKPTLWQRVRRDGSYLSASDATVHFGLGSDPDIQEVVVHWPDGGVEKWKSVTVDSLIILTRGEGEFMA
ncbi:MAG TPA: CRTAC1 family protein, partial [Acidobacteriota bacterium]|nr:CRTAC1 family protein [Acidobacteriota bacterium]